MDGFIKLHRKIFECEALRGQPSTGWVFLWMISEAKIKPQHGLQRGQLRHSASFIAEAIGISLPTVKRAFRRLQEAGMIERDGRGFGISAVTTIVNYDLYQSYQNDPNGVSNFTHTWDQNDPNDDTNGDTIGDTNGDTQLEEREEGSKKEKKNSPTPKTAIELTGFVFDVIGNQEDKTWTLSKPNYDTLVEAYPAVDLDAELRKIRAWVIANPRNRKTPNGMLRFLNNWLSKTQNQAATQNGQGKKQIRLQI